jgi:hypothetical protein
LLNLYPSGFWKFLIKKTKQKKDVNTEKEITFQTSGFEAFGTFCGSNCIVFCFFTFI